MSKKRLAINMIANFIAFFVNFAISFFLTPYIVRTVGVEAYGFVTLANNFVNYVTLVTVALNSMAGRFITIQIYKENMEGANRYFSSVILANIFTALILTIPSVIIVLFIDKIVNVPLAILFDVKLLWGFLFFNCLLNLTTGTYGVVFFAQNRLDLSAKRSMESNLIRAAILLLAFCLFKPAVWYLGFASVLCTIYISITNIYYNKKLIPELKFDKRLFDFRIIWELILSGIWNTVNRLSSILNTGLDLLITNLFINATVMGQLSLVKTVPSFLDSFVAMISTNFSPNLTILYAQNKKDDMVREINFAVRIMGFIINIPIVVFLVLSQDFFKLWAPTQEATLLSVLSALTLAVLMFSGSISPIYNIFTITNRLRANSLVVFGMGVLNIVLVFILLNLTGLGIYAIVGVSSVLGILRNLMFTVPYSAKCLGVKWTTFYKPVLYNFFTVVFITIALYLIKIWIQFTADTWISYFCVALLIALIVLITNYFCILNKSERKLVWNYAQKTFEKIRWSK